MILTLSLCLPALIGLVDRSSLDEDPARTLSEDLGFEVLVAERLPAPSAELLDKVQRRLASPGASGRTRLYIGLAIDPRTESETEQFFASIPLGQAPSDGRLVISMRESELTYLSVAGTQSFEEDPDSRWAIFLGRLSGASRRMNKAADPSLWKKVSARIAEPKSQADRQLATLAHQRQAMFENRQLLAGLSLLLEQGKTAPPEWFTRSILNMKRLAEHSSELESTLGAENVPVHNEAASGLARALEEMQSVARKQDAATLEKLVTENGARCDACHNSTVGEDGLTWMAASRKGRSVNGLPSGVLRVGYDVAPALGDEGPMSQTLADALHAGILLLQNASAF